MSSGGNSLFPVGGRNLLNFRQNFQISNNPPPPFALEKAVFSPLIGQNCRKFVIFHERGGGGRPPRPNEISATGHVKSSNSDWTGSSHLKSSPVITVGFEILHNPLNVIQTVVNGIMKLRINPKWRTSLLSVKIFQ
jgi:hypothetical protein